MSSRVLVGVSAERQEGIRNAYQKWIEILHLGVQLFPFLRTEISERNSNVLACIVPFALAVIKAFCGSSEFKT